MPKVELPASSGAASFVAQIKEREKAAQAEKQASLTDTDKVPVNEEVAAQLGTNVDTAVQKDSKKKGGANRLHIPIPAKKEPKEDTITFRITKSRKQQFRKKCEAEGVSQNYILSQLVDIWVQMGE